MHSETRRLTARENAAIGACASRYYVCNGHCQNSPPGEARTACEAECLRVYNACVEASVPALAPADLRVTPSPSAVAPATPTPTMRRNISPQRVTGVTTTTKSQSTIAAQGVPRGGVSQPTAASPTPPPTPTPKPLNFSRRPIGGVMRAKPTPTISPQGAPRDTASTSSRPPPTPTISPQRSTSGRKSHRRHRSNATSPTPTPTSTSQPTPET